MKYQVLVGPDEDGAFVAEHGEPVPPQKIEDVAESVFERRKTAYEELAKEDGALSRAIVEGERGATVSRREVFEVLKDNQ